MTQTPLPGQPGQVRHLVVDEGAAGQRIDNFLLRHLPGVPRSHVYRLLRSGQVRIDGGRAKPERKLVVGESVRIPPVRVAERGEAPRAPDALTQRLLDAIIHEDDGYLALNKPAGIPVHGGSGVAFGVIEVLRAARPQERLELCHRIDRDTSGVLLIARGRPALLRAQQAFVAGDTRKSYLALLAGDWKGATQEVRDALQTGHRVAGERRVVADDDGKAAVSRFNTLARYGLATLCGVQILTGRTHQIRVHASLLGHPLAGDERYGRRELDAPLRALGLRRLFLHAHRLELPAVGDWPALALEAPLPAELGTFLRTIDRARHAAVDENDDDLTIVDEDDDRVNDDDAA